MAETESIGTVLPVSIVEEMQKSYLDYAMSVIVSRALPDARDGLKPVQRRIIYAMHQMGLTSHARYSKSAKVVGEVLGKYHPHGDMSVYEALVRMAQEFSLRYPHIDGQGNFGSVDGDAAAAMRYTEVRLAPIAQELLADIDKQTVKFTPNFDDSLTEPQVLPTMLPNLLLNGASGIAVGMATNIPPHNLGEIVDGLLLLMEHRVPNQPTFASTTTTEELIKVIKGPDFPTGGVIYDQVEITNSYATGRGRILMRAKTEVEETRTGKAAIIVTELPYQVNKALLVARIADLVREKKIEGVSDLRDESDRRGMRIVVELKRDANPQAVQNNLYRHTAMQSVFNANMVALIAGTPQLTTLKLLLETFIQHRHVVITKRSQYELAQAQARAHILEGLTIALDSLDAVIETIRRSRDADTARKNLMVKFTLSEIQATAILDMQLRRLAALERQKIEDEYAAVMKTIVHLEDLLAHPDKIFAVIEKELKTLKETYGDERRTRVIKGKVGEFSEEDLVPNEPTIIAFTRSGYIKRQGLDSFRTQHRGGKGVTGMTTKEEDGVLHILSAATHDNILFFTDHGRVFQIKAYEIAEGSRTAKGQAVINLIAIDQGEKVTSLLVVPKASDKTHAVMVTKRGTVKKTHLSQYATIRRSGMLAIKLEKDDELRWARLTTGSSDLILVTRKGQSIRFSEKDVRATARDTIGVRGIKLSGNDEVIGMEIFDTDDADLLVVMERGLGKRTKVSSWTQQGRGGQGVKAAQVTRKTGEIVSAKLIGSSDEQLILTSIKGQVIKLPLKAVPRLRRQTQGVILMRLPATDRVASATCFGKDETLVSGTQNL